MHSAGLKKDLLDITNFSIQTTLLPLSTQQRTLEAPLPQIYLFYNSGTMSPPTN